MKRTERMDELMSLKSEAIHVVGDFSRLFKKFGVITPPMHRDYVIIVRVATGLNDRDDVIEITNLANRIFDGSLVRVKDGPGYELETERVMRQTMDRFVASVGRVFGQPPVPTAARHGSDPAAGESGTGSPAPASSAEPRSQ